MICCIISFSLGVAARKGDQKSFQAPVFTRSVSTPTLSIRPRKLNFMAMTPMEPVMQVG